MNQTLNCWLFAGCVAATFFPARPTLGQDATERSSAETLTATAEAVRDTLQKIEPFPAAVLESHLVGIQFSFLSVDASTADAVFFAEQKEFQQLVKRVSPTTQLRIEESQLAHSWNRVVRSSLIPHLLAEIDRQQPDAEMSVLSERHAVASLGRQFYISLDGSPNSAAEIVDEPISGFNWLERIRLTPVLETSRRLSLTAHFVVRPVAEDIDHVTKARVDTARVLLNEDQSAVALLRGSDDDERTLLIVMTPGRAKSTADELSRKEEPDDAIAFAAAFSDAQVDAPEQAESTPPTQQPTAPADTPREDTAPATDAQLLKEIRELRTLIENVRGDVLRLRYELRQQKSNKASQNETTRPEALQSATEVIRVPASQSRLFDRDRAVTRIALADPGIVDVTQYSPKQFGIVGLKPGTTTVSVWFDGEENPLMLTVHVDGPGEPVDVLLTPQQTDAHHAIEKALDQPVELQFSDAPLVEILRFIAEQAGINMVIDAPGLEEEGVTTNTETTIHLKKVTLRSALRVLLNDLNLGWTIENEALTITSKTRLEGKLITQAYQVMKLAGPENSKEQKEQQLERLVELITATVAPDTWEELGGPGSIRTFPGGASLVIRQTEGVHSQIQVLLQSLTKLLVSQTQDAVKTQLPVQSWNQERFPVRTVDKLQMENVLGGGRQPVVVVETPSPETYRPGQQSGLTLRGPSGTPLEVGRGGGQRATEGRLPRVAVDGGIYVDHPRSTIKPVTREYTPSRTLLVTFQKEGESDSVAAAKLVEHIRKTINPESWKADDARIEVYVSGTVRVVIRHTPGTHDRVRRLLERMETEARDEQPDKTPDSGQAEIRVPAKSSKLVAPGAFPRGDESANRARGWDHIVWNDLGLKLGPSISADAIKSPATYRGGLALTDVREDSYAAVAGLRQGDVLVGIHIWETLTREDVGYVLSRIKERNVQSPLKFYAIRNGETMVGQTSLSDGLD